MFQFDVEIQGSKFRLEVQVGRTFRVAVGVFVGIFFVGVHSKAWSSGFWGFSLSGSVIRFSEIQGSKFEVLGSGFEVQGQKVGKVHGCESSRKFTVCGSSVHGRCGSSLHVMEVHFTVWKFTSRCGSSVHGMEVQFTVWKFNSRYGSSVHGVEVQFTVWKFSSRCGSSIHGVEVQFTVWKFNSRCGSSIHGVEVQLWKFTAVGSSQRWKFTALEVHSVGSSQRWKFTALEVHSVGSSQRWKSKKWNFRVGNSVTEIQLLKIKV